MVRTVLCGFRAVVVGLGLMVGLAACGDKVAECKATTDRVAKEKIAKCADDACKKAAEAERKSFYEACETSGK